MKIINLSRTNKTKTDLEVGKYIGEKYIQYFFSFGLQTSLSGFTFNDPISTSSDQVFKVSMAFHTKGLAFYCRNIYQNKLVLFSIDELISIELFKKKEVIQPLTCSVYSILKLCRVHDDIAVKYLMPVEIKIEHKPILTIVTPETRFTIISEKHSFSKIFDILNRSLFSSLIHAVDENVSLKS